MKCETCQGRGFTELEHGLVMVGCEVCNGTGEIDGSDSRVGQPSTTTYTGLLLQLDGIRTNEYSDAQLWRMAKEKATEEMSFPYIVTMPCDHKEIFHKEENVMDLPIENIPCPCDNPNHYIVQFSDMREVINVSSDGTESDNQPIGSTDTSKPKRTRKSKIKEKARKGTS